MTSDFHELTSLFAGLDPIAVREVQEASTEVHFKEGEAVFRQGDPGDALYIVLSGALEVTVDTSTGERYRLETVTTGEWVGELSLASDRPRVASVFALQSSTAVRVPATACHRLIAAEPNAKQQFLDTAFRRLPSHHLSVTSLFAGLQPDILRKLDHRLHWIRLPGGETLCRQGDPGDAVFIVVNGSMEVLVGSGDGERLVDVLERGASIGEMVALTGETRSATVRAIRDSDLILIPRAEFMQLLDEHSQIAVNLARMLAVRLRQTTIAPQLTRTVRTIAVISATASPIPSGFVEALTAALAPLNGRSRHIGSREVDAELGAGTACVAFGDDARGRLRSWLDAQQSTSGVVVYECDAAASAWTLRALRQSDLVLIVARGEEPPATGPIEQALSAGADLSRIRQELVLVHTGDGQPKGTGRWIALRAPARHHHLRAGNAADFARLARSISGASIGVALSGGGTRGFAHIGLLQALRDRGIAVDSIGGTSMGSVIAAQAALGWDTATMIESNRKAFTECAVLADLTFPFVALMRGRSTVQLLRSMFGDVQIEDLRLPYFCVSTNLSRAEVVVHDHGPLWLWVRASSAVPGIGPPVPCGGDLLVDGGLLNNLPVDILRQRCTGQVIASDASPSVDLTTRLETCAEMSGWTQLWRKLNPWSRAAAFPNVFEILMRTVAMSSDHSLEQMKKEADLYLHPPLDGINALDWAAIDRVVEIGYRHACEQLDAWQKSSSPQVRSSTLIHA
jgi:lysophospholipid hydrolase